MSETREGPGWWMAPDGGWNPPEMWPEASPPLPGWVRGADGMWSSPEAAAAAAAKSKSEDVEPPRADSTKLSFTTQDQSDELVLDLRDSAASSGEHIPQHSAPESSLIPGAEAASGREPQHRLSLGFGLSEAQPDQVIREVERQGLTRRRMFLIAIAILAGAVAGLVFALVLL